MFTIDVNDEVKITFNIKILNLYNSPLISSKLKKAIDGHDKNFVINLEKVQSIDSSSIAMFVEFMKLIKDSNKELTFINISPPVRQIFDTLRISKLFKIE